MRYSIGLLGGLVTLFVGWQALGMAATNAQTAVANNSTQMAKDAYNMSEGIFSGVGQSGVSTLGIAVPAVFVLLALGVLLVAARGGGR